MNLCSSKRASSSLEHTCSLHILHNETNSSSAQYCISTSVLRTDGTYVLSCSFNYMYMHCDITAVGDAAYPLKMGRACCQGPPQRGGDHEA